MMLQVGVDGNSRVSKAVSPAECDSRPRRHPRIMSSIPFFFALSDTYIYLWRPEFYAKSITLLRVQHV